MEIEAKKESLRQLIDVLCDLDFRKKEAVVEEWISKLTEIYADGYRHTYSDIFYKTQEILAGETEKVEILGENLNYLRTKIEEQAELPFDSEKFKTVLASYNKFADHINLEIGRYNFIKGQFQNTQTLTADNDIDETKFETRISEIEKTVDTMRATTTRAQKELDIVDSKLENNKISSITALTIFSAVVLAFSGGFAFEANMLEGMAHSTAYRLVFVIALTGFVLFNTIFALLYLVGKLTGKPICAKCRYATDDSNNGEYLKCGEAYCKKELGTGSNTCRIINKYFFILLVNIVLLCTMYFDFFLWYANGNLRSTVFKMSLIVPIIILILFMITKWIRYGIFLHRNKVQFKVMLLRNVVAQEEKESNFLATVALNALRRILKSAPSSAELYESEIKGKTYSEAIDILNNITNEAMLQERKNLVSISLKQHKLNKLKLKRYKDKLKKQQSEIEVVK